MFSVTVKSTIRPLSKRFSGTWATPNRWISRGEAVVTSLPAIDTVPASDGRSPMIDSTNSV